MNEALELNSQFVADFRRLQRESEEARSDSVSSGNSQRELAATREQLNQLRRQLAELEGHVEQRRAQRDDALRQRDKLKERAGVAQQRVAQLEARLQGRAADTGQARRLSEQLQVAQKQRDTALKQVGQLELELQHARQELQEVQRRSKKLAATPQAAPPSQYPCPECGHQHELDLENLEELSRGQKKIWQCAGCSHLFWLTPPKSTETGQADTNAAGDGRLRAALQSLQKKLESLEVDHRLLNEKHKRLKKQNYELHNELMRLRADD